MNDTTLECLQSCLDRMKAGDPTARDDLIRMSYHRLDALVRRMLKKDDRVASWEQADDVLQNAALRLWRSLERVAPGSVAEFLGLAATQIRRELIDLARHYFGQQGAGQHQAPPAPGGADGCDGPRVRNARRPPTTPRGWPRGPSSTRGRGLPPTSAALRDALVPRAAARTRSLSSSGSMSAPLSAAARGAAQAP